MRWAAALAMALGATCLSGAAQAQSFFACKANDGAPWGLYRLQGQSIQLWSPGNGWSADLCVERGCSITDNQIEMRWTARDEGQYAYTDQEHILAINRRSGTGSRRYIADQWQYDGKPYAPHGWNPHSDVTTNGTCQKAEDPEAGPPKF